MLEDCRIADCKDDVSDDVMIVHTSTTFPCKKKTKRKKMGKNSTVIDLSMNPEPITMSSIPTMSPQKIISIQCAVCLDFIDRQDLYSTVCGHVFCYSCITLAIENSKKCPLCRKKLTVQKIHPLYI
jgi:hypothetical protein